MAKQMEKESTQKEKTMISKEPNGLLGLVWNRAIPKDLLRSILNQQDIYSMLPLGQ